MGLTPLVQARHFAQNHTRYHAGVPGPLGSTQCGREIKSSEFGYKIVDVYTKSQGTTVGTLARTQERNMKRDGFKTQYGWDHSDRRAPDLLHEPLVGAIPQLTWHNKVATVRQGVAKGGSHALPRGGNTPRVVDVIDDQGGAPWFDPQGYQVRSRRCCVLLAPRSLPILRRTFLAGRSVCVDQAGNSTRCPPDLLLSRCRMNEGRGKPDVAVAVLSTMHLSRPSMTVELL